MRRVLRQDVRGLSVWIIAIFFTSPCWRAVSEDLLPKDWRVASTTRVPDAGLLRGYGRVQASFQEVVSPDGKATLHVANFETASPLDAETLAAKYFADVSLAPGAKEGTLEVGGRPFRKLLLEGGETVIGAVLERKVLFIAGKEEGIILLAKESPVFSSREAKTVGAKYPMFLDRFDRYGWGFYGIGGVSNFHNWKAYPGGSKDADPMDDLKFCAKYNFRFDVWLDSSEFDNSHGLPYSPEVFWEVNEAEKLGLPVSARLYQSLPQSWEYSDSFEKPADFLETGWYNGSFQFRTWRHQSWREERGNRFLAWLTKKQMAPWVENKNFLSWMLPIGEVGPDSWYALNGDFSPAARESWVAYLRDSNGIKLEQASKMYGQGDKPFPSWDQVPIPEFATFAGLSEQLLDLGGQWHARFEAPGETGEWWKADVKEKEWKVLKKPGSETWFNDDSKRGLNRLCIRDFQLPDHFAKDKPVYLYLFLRPAEYGAANQRIPVYVNGVEAGKVGLWGGLDVTKFLRSGENRVAFATPVFTGRVFLSSKAPSVFPYLGEDMNRLWVLFRNWQTDGPAHFSENILAGMRQVDSNRPIKMMAPTGMRSDNWLKIASQYGSWPHFTGEGMWYYPWYKRYAFVYGIPATSEGSQPCKDVKAMENLFQRVFLAGLNGHDQVFTVQAITRKPELKAWYEKHVATLKQLGRYDIAGPQVLIYRSTKNEKYPSPPFFPLLAGDRASIQTVWDWDLGRGTMQSIGQSYLYLDEKGVADGKLKNHGILIDGGNEVIDEEVLKNIERWVREGGTFIVWPFTGRSTFFKSDTWPIRSLTGCSIKALRKPGSGTVTIAKDQPYLKGWAGKSFPDNGQSVDWQGINHNKLSLELDPCPESQVIASYENGSAAIVVRPLGAGKIVVLGSAFFRDSKDQSGIWWPGEIERNFFDELLTSLGQPSVNSTGHPLVWAQRYRMNSGFDEVVTLVNFAEGEQNVTLQATVDGKPSKVYEVAGDRIREVPFEETAGRLVIRNATVANKGVNLYLIRAHDSGSAIQHWWSYQQKMWHPIEIKPVDLSEFGKDGWGGNVQGLSQDWSWSQKVEPDWYSEAYLDEGWKPGALTILNYYGIDEKKPVYLRRKFSVPEHWFKDGGDTKLVLGAFNGNVHPGGWDAGSQIYLNGQLVKEGGQTSYFEKNITRWLKPGVNTLAVSVKGGDSKFVGFMGTLYLTHSEPPEKTLPVSLKWKAGIDGKELEFELPGVVPKGLYAPPFRFPVPPEWREKYYVVFYASGQKDSFVGVTLNGKYVRPHHHRFADNIELDLTPYLMFGSENSLVIQRAGDKDWDISKMEIRLYPRKK